MTLKRFISRLKSFYGVIEGTTRHKQIVMMYNNIDPLPEGYLLRLKDSWCMAFLSAVAYDVGLKDFPYECSCIRAVDKLGPKFIKEPKTIKKGMLIFYTMGKSQNPNHVGLITNVKGDTLTVIEGNKSDSVGYRTIKTDSKLIYGYGIVKYADETKSDVEIAEEVVAGKWGNGEERQLKLERAGYDYDNIQKIVNRLVVKKPKRRR